MNRCEKPRSVLPGGKVSNMSYSLMSMNHRVGIIGATGWLGELLAPVLLQRGHHVTGFSRSAQPNGSISWRQWDTESVPDFSGLDAVINLAGEAIDQRWTAERKVKFFESRVDLTNYLVQGIQASEVGVLLNASAIGFYGDRGDEQLTETAESGDGYLAGLCLDWEKAAQCPDVRVVLLRTGVVLGKGGRAWDKISKVFRLGIGGRLGSGQQWMPWIHVDDEIAAIVHCLENDIAGPVNLVAPHSERNTVFTRKVAKAIHRPAIFPAPAFMLKLALGDFAEEGLLASTRVIPEVLQKTGFEFKYPTFEDALAELTRDSVNR